jgi:hypothetical protein
MAATTPSILEPSVTNMTVRAADLTPLLEEALGDAYTEPAADVRGYIEYVTSQR